MGLKRPKPAWQVCKVRIILVFVRLRGATAWAPGVHKQHMEVVGCPHHPRSRDGNPPIQSQEQGWQSPQPNPRAEGSIPGRALSHQHHTGKELHTSSQVVLGASQFFQSWTMCQMESGDREAHRWMCHTDTFPISHTISKIPHVPLVTASAGSTRLTEHF